jgi:hypothetical protein
MDSRAEGIENAMQVPFFRGVHRLERRRHDIGEGGLVELNLLRSRASASMHRLHPWPGRCRDRRAVVAIDRGWSGRSSPSRRKMSAPTEFNLPRCASCFSNMISATCRAGLLVGNSIIASPLRSFHTSRAMSVNAWGFFA